MEQPSMHQESAGWLFFVHVAFALSLFMTGLGVYMLPVSLWIKGYLIFRLSPPRSFESL